MTAEVVICSAVKTTCGLIIRCHRHHDGLAAIHARGLRADEASDDSQGFITSENRYVNRKQGFRLQIAASVPSAAPGGYRFPNLFSEDLY